MLETRNLVWFLVLASVLRKKDNFLVVKFFRLVLGDFKARLVRFLEFCVRFRMIQSVFCRFSLVEIVAH